MSISSEITRIQNKRDQSFTEVANKGVTVPAGSTIDDLPGLIAQIEQGSGSGSGGIIYQDLDGYLNLSEDEANVISIVDTLDTAGGTIRTITSKVEDRQTPRVLTNSWDFTSCLVDSIGSLAVTLGNGATQTSSGLTISESAQFATVPVSYAVNKTYEIDFGGFEKSFSSGHGRLFMPTGTEGLIVQNGTTWNVYYGGAWSGLNNGTFSASTLANKTLRIITEPISFYANGSEVQRIKSRFYVDGQLWFNPAAFQGISNSNIMFGSSAGASFCTVTITGFRIYDGIGD